MTDRPVALITGTSRGLGRALAEHYLGKTHRVIGCSRGDAAVSDDNYTHVTLDVRDESAVLELFRTIRAKFGRLDHLVNNAGIASMNHAVTTPVETVRGILDTNVTAPFLFAREAAKLMMKRRFGRVVNFSSVAVPLRLDGEAAYAASKAAVETLTGILAREFAQFGITVNAVGPGPVDTDLIKGVPRDRIDALVQRQAIARLCTPEDVVNAVDFFLAEASGMVTGQVLYLGGV